MEKYFVLALFLQALFPIVLLQMMFVKRVRAVKEGKVPTSYFKSYQLVGQEVPRDLVVVSNHYSNLFEMPLMFLIVGILFINFKLIDTVAMAAAWLYVFLRLGHSIIHLGKNKLVYRYTIFGLSSYVQLFMWIYLIGKVFLQ